MRKLRTPCVILTPAWHVKHSRWLAVIYSKLFQNIFFHRPPLWSPVWIFWYSWICQNQLMFLQGVLGSQHGGLAFSIHILGFFSQSSLWIHKVFLSFLLDSNLWRSVALSHESLTYENEDLELSAIQQVLKGCSCIMSHFDVREFK